MNTALLLMIVLWVFLLSCVLVCFIVGVYKNSHYKNQIEVYNEAIDMLVERNKKRKIQILRLAAKKKGNL